MEDNAMRPAARWLVSTLCLAIVAAASAPAAAAAGPKIMVVPIPGTAGPFFETQVMKLLPGQLAAGAKVVPLAQGRAAFQKTKIKPASMKVPKNASLFGKAAGLDYVLVVEGTGTRPRLAAITTLVRVKGAKLVHSDRYVVAKGQFTGAIAAQIATATLDQLGDTTTESFADGNKARGHGAYASRGDPVEGEDPTEPSTMVKEEGDAAADSEEDKSVPAGERGDKWRPALRLRAGMTLLQRTGTINPKVADPTITTPCYCGTARNKNPFFPGVGLALDIFPFAFQGDGSSVLEGLGVNVELFWTTLLTQIDDSATSTVRSSLLGFKAGAAFRYVLWDSPLAADLQLGLGLTTFSFPISAGPYPGVSYKAPYINAKANVPMGIKQLQGMVGLGVLLGLKTGEQAETWLGTQGTGTGFNLDLGVRLAVLANLEAAIMYRLEYFSIPFTGPTNLPLSAQKTDSSTPVVLNDVALHDTLHQILLTAAFVF